MKNKIILCFLVSQFCLVSTLHAWWLPNVGNVGPGPNGSWPSYAEACQVCLHDFSSVGTCNWDGRLTGTDPNSKGCGFWCNDGAGYGGDQGCTVSETKHLCPPPFLLNVTSNVCEAKCATYATWDSVAKKCVQKDDRSCEEITANPINVDRGEKYRTEEIISVGNASPIRLVYSYNNRTNSQLAGASVLYNPNVPTYVAATMAPISELEYQARYTSQFVAKTANAAQNQFRANWYRPWRHNYEEGLEFGLDNRILWLRSDGEDIYFSHGGSSEVINGYRISLLELTEFGFAGYKIVSSQYQKVFDGMGRLRRWIFNDASYHNVLYAENNVDILKITNSNGGELSFSYASYNEDIASSPNKIISNYPIVLLDSTGRSVGIEWAASYTGKKRKYYVLTKYSHPYVNAASSAREFTYGDARWPASITDIYDVSDITSNTRKLYAHFDYDAQGRAIYSGLAGGADAVRVNYIDDLTRELTNALGKKSRYTFADIDGVRRLNSVTGEPTATCLKSEARFEYDAAGNIKNEVKNGVISHRKYDGQNREILRTEAFGTTDATTTQTCWHTILNKPTRIIEATNITLMDYWPNGQLKTQFTKPRPAGTITCDTAL